MDLNDKRPGEGGTRTLVKWDYSVCETCVKGLRGGSNVIMLCARLHSHFIGLNAKRLAPLTSTYRTSVWSCVTELRSASSTFKWWRQLPTYISFS